METPGKRRKTIDDIINDIGRSPNLAMFLIATLAMSCSMVGCYCAYMVKFTGILLDWKCVDGSEACSLVKAQFTDDQGNGKL